MTGKDFILLSCSRKALTLKELTSRMYLLETIGYNIHYRYRISNGYLLSSKVANLVDVLESEGYIKQSSLGLYTITDSGDYELYWTLLNYTEYVRLNKVMTLLDKLNRDGVVYVAILDRVMKETLGNVDLNVLKHDESVILNSVYSITSNNSEDDFQEGLWYLRQLKEAFSYEVH